MKKIYYLTFILLLIVVLEGCSKPSKKEETGDEKDDKGKVFTCKNTEKTTGLKSLSSYTIEVNDDNVPIKYIMITGYGNYGEDIASYEKFCSGLKEGLAKQTEIDEYKEVAQIEITCDDKKLEAYATKTYQLEGIKNIEYFQAINEYIEEYIKEDGTFNAEEWKNFYMTDPVYQEKFTCNF